MMHYSRTNRTNFTLLTVNYKSYIKGNSHLMEVVLTRKIKKTKPIFSFISSTSRQTHTENKY